MRILVVRIGRAGDMVMITPALKALLSCYPQALFTLLTSPDGNRLLKNYSAQIDDIRIWNRSSLTSTLQKLSIRRQLKKTNFDMVFCFETSKSIAKLTNNIAKRSFYQQAYQNNIHHAQVSLNLVAEACSTSPNFLPVNLPVSKEALDNIDTELKSIGITDSDFIIALHPTYSGFLSNNPKKRHIRKHKLWPAKHFSELAKSLCSIKLPNGKHPKVIIDLLDSEIPLGEKISELAQGSIHLINTKPNFERYKALLKRTNLLVAPDTGPMHIAAAVNTRIIALFSNKDPQDCGPYTDPERFITLRSEHTDSPEKGISAITVESVLSACHKQINKHFGQ
ncbi:MAG: hypothetical protein OEY06_01275 [Gammaproteobacteria bacterium]|nr:hypothetical protein [Gammaproteobacteria bacterium]